MHHIEIYVSDLEQSKLFYKHLLVENLGFEEFQNWPEGISYKKDNFYLVFVQVVAKYNDVPFKRTRVGLNHLAFNITQRNTLNQLREYYQEKNQVLYDDAYPYAGGEKHYALYLEDPDRIKIEIVLVD